MSVWSTTQAKAIIWNIETKLITTYNLRARQYMPNEIIEDPEHS
jgi:hypothetical protein